MGWLQKFTGTAAVIGAMLVVGAGAPATAGENLDRVMSNGVLKVATDANWPPMSFLNENNEMDGFDVAVAREIGKRMGVEVEFVTPQWGVITAGNWNGRWDISVGSMTPTTERAKVLSFPGVYYYTPAVLAVHSDADVDSVDDVNGKRIAATQASVYELYLNKDLVIDAQGVPDFDYKIDVGELKSYESTTTALDDLRLGNGVRVDAIVAGLPTFVTAKDNNYPVKVIGTPLFYEPLSAAIDIGDPEFNDKVAGIISDMHADGTLTKLSEKWHGLDYTKVVE
ncbi:transporter substrate-binding domain-containing protein [Rhodovibrionaceae bacterium A322]